MTFLPHLVPLRYRAGAGEPGVAGALVLRVPGRPALLPGPRGPPALPAARPAPRLRGGPGAGAQAPVCLPHPALQHGDGCSGGMVQDKMR